MLAPRKKLWSTPMEVVDTAIDMLQIEPNFDLVMDIGAGDGRFMVRCSESTGASVIGVEIDEERGQEAISKIEDANLQDKCKLIIGNALDQDYNACNKFFLYLIPRGLRIVLPILQAIPHPIRVVTYISPFPEEVQPVQVLRVKSVAHADAGVEWPLYVYELNNSSNTSTVSRVLVPALVPVVMFIAALLKENQKR
jgi:ubiquinone/menaquinone biosynthesis C-methylase UbiE